MDYYGNNDWRDYLAHYGVKGMKWRNHKYITGENGRYTYNIGGITGRFGTDKQDSSGRTGYKTTSKYLTLGKNNQHRVNVGKTTHPTKDTTYSAFTTLGASKKAKTKKIGRFTITRDEDGTSIEYKKKRAKTKVDKMLEKNKKAVSIVNATGTKTWKKAISNTSSAEKPKSKKPLKRKKKVESGGTGVQRGEFKRWYTTSLRGGRSSRKGLSNVVSSSKAKNSKKKSKKVKGYTQ